MVQDRRVRKSQQAIQSAFLELLKGESFEKLTVQQLADKADINRGTFYSCLLYTSPSPRDPKTSRMPSSA